MKTGLIAGNSHSETISSEAPIAIGERSTTSRKT